MDSREYQGALAQLIAFAVDHVDAPEPRTEPDVAAVIDHLMPPPAFERSYSLTDPPTIDDVRTVLAAHSRDAARVYRAEMYAATSAAVNVGLSLLAELAALTGETRAQVLARVALDGTQDRERAS